jgi:hypothetical protein
VSKVTHLTCGPSSVELAGFLGALHDFLQEGQLESRLNCPAELLLYLRQNPCAATGIALILCSTFISRMFENAMQRESHLVAISLSSVVEFYNASRLPCGVVRRRPEEKSLRAITVKT